MRVSLDVVASDGRQIPADNKINGGPSVLYDAVAILTSKDGAARLSSEATAKDFVSDAYSHLKFIAYNDDAVALLEKAAVINSIDEGFVKLTTAKDAASYLTKCRDLRLWSREPKVKLAN